jgi:hypothetical protein
MGGAEPLSPATLAYFAHAVAQPCGFPASSSAQGVYAQLATPSIEHPAAWGGAGGGSAGAPVLPEGLPAADALSPFHSCGPSPLALLQALQAEADGPDGTDAGADCTVVSLGQRHVLVRARSSHRLSTAVF